MQWLQFLSTHHVLSFFTQIHFTEKHPEKARAAEQYRKEVSTKAGKAHAA